MNWIWRISTRRSKASSGRASTRRWLAGWLPISVFVAVLTCWSAVLTPVLAQGGRGPTQTPAANEMPLEAPGSVDIDPEAHDEEIRERIESILEATGWFINPEVDVQEGVVFLRGQTGTADYKSWAGDLARNTQDVVAVVNQIELIQPPLWNFQPALNSLREIWFGLIGAVPVIGFSLLVLLLTWVVTRLSMAAIRGSIHKRISNPLLNNVAAYTVGTLVFLVGLYIVLRVAGLAGVAATVVGGTGLLGLILGIAFRDITENFLASIFLSIQNPFRNGDLIEINNVLGFVQALTTRVTVLTTLDGIQVQIPNATVYKSNIWNYSSHPNRRVDFMIGIGQDASINGAQETALEVLREHPAVLNDPEPLVLVESLGSATVNLHIFFWLDGTQHSMAKVKSSVIRLVKRAFQTAEISMPDEAREMLFPEGVPVRMLTVDEVPRPGAVRPVPERAKSSQESPAVDTDAEAGLRSEADEIQAQAKQAWKPDEGQNLLDQSDRDKKQP